MLKKINILIVALVLGTFMAGTAMAGSWIGVSLTEVGVYTNVPFLGATATGGAFPGERHYAINTAYANQLLATALSAQSMGKTVQIYVNSVADWDQCTGVRVIN